MVLQNVSLLSSAMPKLYLCSKCSVELQSRMYCTFFHMKTQEMASLCKELNIYIYIYTLLLKSSEFLSACAVY